jgi:small conductance mechanosensitive channel
MSGLQTHLTIFASKLGASLLILATFWVGSTICKKVIQRVARSQDPARQDVVNLVAEIARLALLVFGVVTALGTVGVNISALVAGLGLTGFALGFAFRDALSNILAGVLIVFYHPFRRGDHLAVMGLEGTVTGIDLRYTTLKQNDKTFLIPNATLFTNPLSLTQPAVPVPEPPPAQVPTTPRASPIAATAAREKR